MIVMCFVSDTFGHLGLFKLRFSERGFPSNYPGCNTFHRLSPCANVARKELRRDRKELLALVVRRRTHSIASYSSTHEGTVGCCTALVRHLHPEQTPPTLYFIGTKKFLHFIVVK